MWGSRLAAEAGPSTAAAVLSGRDDGLTPKEACHGARAQRKVVRDPNGTTRATCRSAHDAGWTDGEIFGLTVFSALRVAFSTVNDALGARPDAQLLDVAPQAVLDADRLRLGPSRTPSAPRQGDAERAAGVEAEAG